jgi:hypothetical protein
LHIDGNLRNLHYSVDAAGIVKQVVGNLMEMNGDENRGLEVEAAPEGENACVYTLNHPPKKVAPTYYPAESVGTAAQKFEGIGKSLIDGLLLGN